MSADAAGVEATFSVLCERGVFGPLERHFALAMARLGGEPDPRVLLAAALASHKVQAGHVCVDLPRLCREEDVIETEDGPLRVAWPEPSSWLEALRASPVVACDERPAPLRLDAAGRLYLRRYFEHEQNLARAIRERLSRARAEVDAARLHAGLDRLFGPEPRGTAPARAQLELFAASDADATPDEQRRAAQRAVERAFCVISGGPGTGKTSTVVKILALLVEQRAARGLPAPRMLLLAPTGKAAARLGEAIKRSKSALPVAPEVLAAIPEETSTIHRALGASFGHALRFLHHEDAPLAADVVVVDEASMVDLALMARLFAALPRAARVILLGDKDQLASVEAGAVLGDICGAGLAREAKSTMAIAQSIALLTRSYRYAAGSGIRRLAEAINDADPQRALALLRDPGLPDVSLVPAGASYPWAALEAAAADGFAPLLAAKGATAKLEALGRFAVLCAHRRGPYGQQAINARIEAALRARSAIPAGSARYPGRPVMVTQNDYQARLFNGEVGVLLRDPEDPSRTIANFLAADGRVRAVAAARLPPHESAYALSVHKSQGSEFDEVVIVLPPEPSPVLSRELLYTAVTRARSKVLICASPEIVALAVERTVRRASGLRDALWGDPRAE